MEHGIYDPFPAGFCPDTLWDASVSWDAATPVFSQCLENTFLVWIPCAFLWLMIPLQLNNLRRATHRIERWPFVSTARVVFALCLTILSFVEFCWAVNESRNRDVAQVFLIAPLVQTATFILAILFIDSDRLRARPTSGPLFFFWLLLTAAGIVGFTATLKRGSSSDDLTKVRFLAQVIYFPLVVIQLLLSCFREYFPELDNDTKKPCPEKQASFLNCLLFNWFTSLAYLGWKRPLTADDLWDIQDEDRTKRHVEILQRHWDYEIEKRNRSIEKQNKHGGKLYRPSLAKALWKAYWFPLVTSGLLRLLFDLSIFVAPLILQLLIKFIDDKSQDAWKGYLYAGTMLCTSCIQTLLSNKYLHICLRIGMHVRGSVVAAVYRKALKMTSEAKRSSNMGEIVNLMAVDAQRFMDFMTYFHILWSGIFQITLAILFLWRLLGIAALAGLITMLVMVPINAVIVTRVRRLQGVQMKEKDERIKLMSEILTGMKVLKLYAWEESFERQIGEIRERELDVLKRATYLGVASYFTWIISPFLVSLATFTTYVLVNESNVLNAEKAFVALSLLNILRTPLTLLPTAITMSVQVAIALKRLNKFFGNEELDLDCVEELTPLDDNAVKVVGGNFAWGRADEDFLENINLNIKEGQLVAIVGQVGSGKTSLCSALLGLMNKRTGQVGIKGSVAYVPQQAWIQNLTVRENILFGKEMKSARYQRTLDACSLRTDLELLSAGDETEIGERGTNLSGGQRQRVNLARAVYSNSDVYLLDDPLSAVDAHVGKHIFDEVIGPDGILRNKTRILVTHGVAYLPQTDLIVVMNNGIISETGTFKELLASGGVFAEFLQTYLIEQMSEDREDDGLTSEIKEEILKQINANKIGRSISGYSRISARSGGTPLSPRDIVNWIDFAGNTKGQLGGLETSQVGGVKWSVYFILAKQMSVKVVLGMLIFYLIVNTMSMGANFWLAAWANDAQQSTLRNDTSQRDYRLEIYATFGGIQGIFVICASCTLAYGRIRASRLLHQGMLSRIMRAPMSFFDTTPLGRIVNRFSKDIDAIDVMIPSNIEVWMYCAFTVLSTVVVISINTPEFLVILVPLAVFYYFMQKFYISTSRQLKRLEAVSRSPIFSHFQESIAGSSVILATKQSHRFTAENERLVDINNASYYPNMVSQRWIAVRLEFVGICVTFFAALFGVIGRDRESWGVSSHQIGLSISYSLGITQILSWFVRMMSDLESNMVSVERIKEYSEIPNEADWIIPHHRAPPNWPSTGHVEFKDYKTRYRPELDLVLNGVNASIIPGEKIGIVGRTGAGKSSLTLALFRLIEAVDGQINIDGVDISKLGLHDVRSNITILPQEPILFSGTLRLNLDPFNMFTDTEVWKALENSHLKRFVANQPEGLQHMVTDGGENYSVGQRQLICLARALLRKTKIMVLDEATAAIDLETDDLIQETIRENFADCTVLTIAHRLNTIMDSTRIMVLNQGKVEEFDTPQKLLADKDGLFYSLAKTANLLPRDDLIDLTD